MGGVGLELDVLAGKRRRGFAAGSEDGTRGLEPSGDSAPYIDRATDPDGVVHSVEIVRDDSMLVAGPLPIRANPVSAYLAGLAESSRTRCARTSRP